MIIDAFLYAGETSMLELRLRTLRDVVDVFVPVMCSLTHQGEPTGATGEAVSEWSPALAFPTIKPYVVDPSPMPAGERGGVGTRWYQFIERQHRDGVRAACDAAGVPGDAVVMVSDVDEIPDPHAVIRAAELLASSWTSHGGGLTVVFEQRFHSTALDLLHPQQPWLGTVIGSMSGLAPQAWRDDRVRLYEQGHVVENGGWHFSWFGTDTERQTKLNTFSHAELRGTFDPVAARNDGRHSNGEELRELAAGEFARLSWPTPIADGSFTIPQSWWWRPPIAPGPVS